MRGLERIVDFILILILAGIIATVTLPLAFSLYFSKEARNERIRSMYTEIQKQTGQRELNVPLVIVSESTINAYTDGTAVYLLQGLIDQATDDELALVIGHEIAHVTLRHTSVYSVGLDTRIAELQADKMGSIYMMKAGYDICAGRNMMRKFTQLYGDSALQDHPSNSYRYDQLRMAWCSDD